MICPQPGEVNIGNCTTQTCSACGYVMKGKEHLTLRDREWECPNCHTSHKRDQNAVQNILQRGLELAAML